MNNKCYIILILSALTNVFNAWYGVWIAKTLYPLLSGQTLSVTKIVTSALFVTVVSVVIKKVKKPKVQVVVYLRVLVYVSFLSMYYGIETFYIVNASVCAVVFCVTQIFENYVVASNVDNTTRGEFDSNSMLLKRGGAVLGGVISYISILPGVYVLYPIVGVFILFDILIVTKIVLIKKNILNY